jgi:hypothetical protein
MNIDNTDHSEGREVDRVGIELGYIWREKDKQIRYYVDQLAAKEEEITHWKGGYNAANETIKELSKNKILDIDQFVKDNLY